MKLTRSELKQRLKSAEKRAAMWRDYLAKSGHLEDSMIAGMQSKLADEERTIEQLRGKLTVPA